MRALKTTVLGLAFLCLTAVTASAQETTAAPAGTTVAAATELRGLGAGLVIVGAGVGIGLLAASAVAGMARQPEMAATIQTAMIIAAALIEGAAFAALVILYIM